MKEKKLVTQDNFKIPVSVVFLGPPASGKGTTASYLETNFNIKSVSPGNIFKQLRSENNEFTDTIIQTTKNGGLCPDWLTNKIVKSESLKIINSGYKSITLDGYPRTLEQLNYLKDNYDVELFVYSSSHFMTLKKMASNRRNCITCKKVFSNVYGFECSDFDKDYCAKNSKNNWETRWDDSPDFFVKRYAVFKKETAPVIEAVSKLDNFIKLDLLDIANYNVIANHLKK
jgi:adenylate kinase